MGLYWGSIGDNGKEHGNYRGGMDYIGVVTLADAIKVSPAPCGARSILQMSGSAPCCSEDMRGYIGE